MTLIRHIDGTVIDLLEDMPSNGRFYLFIFAGRLMAYAVFKALANTLTSDDSPLQFFSTYSNTGSEFIQCENIKQSNVSGKTRYISSSSTPSTILKSSFPNFPNPFRSGGIGNTKTLLVLDIRHTASLKEGALALVRPDGYISKVTTLDNARGVLDCWKDFMLEGSSDYIIFNAESHNSTGSNSLGGSIGRAS
ncbi:MAG: hypothetical protein Q9179_000274 [Wetmoreana sp. 5 TL-2023]